MGCLMSIAALVLPVGLGQARQMRNRTGGADVRCSLIPESLKSPNWLRTRQFSNCRHLRIDCGLWIDEVSLLGAGARKERRVEPAQRMQRPVAAVRDYFSPAGKVAANAVSEARIIGHGAHRAPLQCPACAADRFLLVSPPAGILNRGNEPVACDVPGDAPGFLCEPLPGILGRERMERDWHRWCCHSLPCESRLVQTAGSDRSD